MKSIIEFFKSDEFLYFKIGAFFLLISFLEFDGTTWIPKSHIYPNNYILSIGIIFVIFGFLYSFRHKLNPPIYLMKLEKGIKLRFEGMNVNVKLGKLEEIDNQTRNLAFILPANTSFCDDCIFDNKSALGSFFLKYHPDKLDKINADVQNILQENKFEKDSDNLYTPGTSIILDKKYDTPARSILTATVMKLAKKGFNTSPDIISTCIKNILEITAIERIDTIRMPIIGSGHGGLDINNALITIINTLKHYSKQFHHIKSLTIVIREDSKSKIKNIFKLFNY